MGYRIVEEQETPRTHGGFRVVRDDGVSVGFYGTHLAALRRLKNAQHVEDCDHGDRCVQCEAFIASMDRGI